MTVWRGTSDSDLAAILCPYSNEPPAPCHGAREARLRVANGFARTADENAHN
jgi:hypothetical protein